MKHVRNLLFVIGLFGSIENLQASGPLKSGVAKVAKVVTQNGLIGSVATAGPKIVESAPSTEYKSYTSQAASGAPAGVHSAVPMYAYNQSSKLSSRAPFQSNSNQISSPNLFNGTAKNNNIKIKIDALHSKQSAIDTTSFDNIVKQAMTAPVQEVSMPVAAQKALINSSSVPQNQSALKGTLFLTSKFKPQQKQELKLVEKPVEVQQAPLLLTYDPKFSLPKQEIVQQEIVIDAVQKQVVPIHIAPEIVPLAKKQFSRTEIDALKNRPEAVAARQVRAHKNQPEIDLQQTIFMDQVAPTVQPAQPGLTQAQIYAQSANNYYTGNKASLNLGKSMQNYYSGQQKPQELQSSWQGQRNSSGLDTTVTAPRARVKPVESSAVVGEVNPEVVGTMNVNLDIVQPVARPVKKYRPIIRKRQNAQEVNVMVHKKNNKPKISDIQSEAELVSPKIEKFTADVTSKMNVEFQNISPTPSRWMIIRMLQRLKQWVLQTLGYHPTAAQELVISQRLNQVGDTLLTQANFHGEISQQALTLGSREFIQDLVNMSATDSVMTNQTKNSVGAVQIEI